MFSDIKNAVAGTVQAWRPSSQSQGDALYEWSDLSDDEGPQRKLNPAILSQDVRSMLGTPIIVNGVCIGVAWIKYQRERIETLQPRFMDLVRGFASQAGLVLELIQRAEVRQGRDGSSVEGRHIAAEMRARWEKNAESPIVIAGVASEPANAVLGGDFYGLKAIDSSTIGILLLDGEGHGLAGSLNMLPLMAAFETATPSYSAAHIIGQLHSTAKAVGTRGTGLYCVISQIAGKRWLTVASTGHHSLILFRKDEFDRWTHQFVPKAAGAMFGHPLSEPLIDEHYDLACGDVLVAYTDGVAEQGTAFDANTMCEILMSSVRNPERTPNAVAVEILGESRSRQGVFQDDATVYVLQVK